MNEIGYCINVNEHKLQFGRGDIPENVKFAVYIDRNKKIWGVDEILASEILAAFGENSKSEMIGNSDFILIYDADQEYKINNHRFIAGDCLIMKSYYGLKCMTAKRMKKQTREKPSILQKLKKFKEIVANMPRKVHEKRKEKEL